jgi:hypothetical protein
VKLTLPVVFAALVISAIAAFAILSAVGVPKEAASACSSALLGALPSVHRYVEKSRILKASPERATAVVSLSEYGWSPVRMVIYGVCVAFAFSRLMGGFGAGLGTMLGLREQDMAAWLALSGIVPAFVTFFLLGRWVGLRVRSHGFLTVVVITVGALVSDGAVRYFLVSNENYALFTGHPKALRTVAVETLVTSVIMLATALPGYWFGRRHRLGAYMSYLLRSVPPESRAVLVELAATEAQRARVDVAAKGGLVPKPPVSQH